MSSYSRIIATSCIFFLRQKAGSRIRVKIYDDGAGSGGGGGGSERCVIFVEARVTVLVKGEGG